MKMLRKWFLFGALCLLAALPHPAHAWGALGHMVVAKIAYKRLNQRAREEADRLLQIPVMPVGDTTNSTFVTAACWADDIKRTNREFNEWHYFDIPFSPDGTSFPAPKADNNVVWAIREQSKILGNRMIPDADRARALRFLLHFVGDIHQPLHCVSRYTAAHSAGDRGGNDFLLPDPDRNLHFFWDDGVGLFGPIERPLNADGETEITELAEEMTSVYSDRRRDWREKAPAKWAEEGNKLAQERVYDLTESVRPSRKYERRGRSIVRKQIAKAGYRLADLLNRLLGR